MVRPDDWIESVWKEPSRRRVSAATGSTSASTSSSGAGERAAARRSPTATNGREGTGFALAMLDCGPPTEHRSGAEMSCARRHAITSRSARPRWATAPSRRTGRSPPRCSARGPNSIDDHQCGHRSHALRHRHLRQHRHRGRRAGRGADRRGAARQHPRLREPPHRRRRRADCRLEDDAVVCGDTADLRSPNCTPPARARGHRFEAKRKAYLSPRTIAFNVQGVRRRGQSHDRRDPHPAQRARRRHRPADQSDAVPWPDRRRHRAWASAGR